MSEPGWVQNTIRIGRFEFKRSFRGLRDSTGRFIFTILSTLVPSVMLLFFGFLFMGILSTDTIAISDGLRGTVAMFWSFAVFLVTQRVVSTYPRPEAESLLLTTASTRSIVFGLALAETLRILAYAIAPILVLTALLAYSIGSVVLMAVVPLVVVIVAATAVVTGSLIGYGIALLLATSPFVARHKTALGVPVVLVFMGVFFVFQVPETLGVSRSAFGWLPMGWLADLVAVGTPLVGSSVNAVGAFAGSILVLVLGGVLLEREATALWFGDEVDPTATTDESGIDSPVADAGSKTRTWTGLRTAISPLVIPSRIDLPTRRVAEMTLLRARRDPRRLSFLIMPLAVLVGPLSISGSFSSLLEQLPILCVTFLPWIFGAAMTLNPLGDEGSVLPVTLVAATPSQFIRGILLPGVVYGAPVAAVITVVTAVGGGYSLPVVVGLAAVAAFVTLVAAPAGAAVGVYLPRFSAVSVGQSNDVLPPRTSAMIVHGILIIPPAGLLAYLIASPGVAELVSEILPIVTPTAVRFGVSAAAVLVGVLVGLTGYRTVIHRVRDYEPT
ncbi:TetR family transcriptional regulator [Halogeometricum borinquense]|uniref:TetR family transcriptional regulator n=1 Tax=Halogeometricum borinquense TaxID=60847 RepID=A0A6C0UF15_9EURY|nr:TetR family transcriptional regulator [Halogeometricum borinquense]QIB74026.1 TetR family transcriptional regulator [Halogeometricum borinquense]